MPFRYNIKPNNIYVCIYIVESNKLANNTLHSSAIIRHTIFWFISSFFSFSGVKGYSNKSIPGLDEDIAKRM